MITEYILKSIKHSGRKGIRNTDCTASKYEELIGSKCKIDVEDIKQFKPYIFEVDSRYYSSWRTSEVLTAGMYFENKECYLEIETVNSIYTFERIKNET